MDKLEDGRNGCHLPLVLFTSFPEIGNTHRVVIEHRRRGGHSLQAGGGADKEQKKLIVRIHCEGIITAHIFKFRGYLMISSIALRWTCDILCDYYYKQTFVDPYESY